MDIGFNVTVVACAIISRHGGRFPVTPILPSDRNEKIDGSLTVKGIKELQQLGSKISQRYNHLLHPKTESNTNLIQAKSSPSPRCVESMQILLDSFNRSDINITIENKMLNYLPGGDLNGMVSRSVEKCGAKFKEENSDIVKRVEKLGGVTLESGMDFLLFGDAIIAERFEGKKLPDWLDAEIENAFIKLYYDNLKGFTEVGSEDGIDKSLYYGSVTPLVTELENEFRNLKDKRLMLAYNTHDPNINFLLKSLNAYDPTVRPLFAATITIEVLQNNGSQEEKSVRIFYWNNEDPDTYPGEVIANYSLESFCAKLRQHS